MSATVPATDFGRGLLDENHHLEAERADMLRKSLDAVIRDLTNLRSQVSSRRLLRHMRLTTEASPVARAMPPDSPWRTRSGLN